MRQPKVFHAPQLIERHPETPTTDLFHHGLSSFAISEAVSADVFVFPFDWDLFRLRPDAVRVFDEFHTRARRMKKRVIVFCSGDFQFNLDYPDIILFQSNLDRSSVRSHHHAFPAIMDDPGMFFPGLDLKRWLNWRYREKERIKRVTVNFRGALTSAVRERAVRVVSQSQSLYFNGRINRRHFAGLYEQGRPSESRLYREQKRYFRHLLQGDYALCVRGTANYSRRFYEIFSVGKIPLFVDTYCCLPFEEFIDYGAMMIHVPETDIDKIPETVCHFVRACDTKDYLALQNRIRRTWVEYLSPAGFFSKLRLYL